MTQLPYRSMRFYPVVSGGGTFSPSNPTLHVVEVPGEEDSPRGPAHGNAARAVINRVDIVFPLRIVEFRRAPIAALEWDFR